MQAKLLLSYNIRMKKYDVIVIGGGLAGIIASLELKKRGVNCALIEAKDRIGKKILASGNGKCNILNSNLSSDKYNSNFVDYVIDKYNYNYLHNYYSNMGIVLKEDQEGRVYPYSESATTILSVLLSQLEKYNVDIILNSKVLSISKKDCFVIKMENESILGDKIIMASGSNASFGFNSHSILGDFGHKVTKLKQTLVPLKTNAFIGANGVRAKTNLSLYIEGKNVFSENGELLFKDGSISGILAFKASSFIAREMVKNNCDKVNAEAVIDFMPEYSKEEVKEILDKSPLDNPLIGVLHKAIALNVEKKGDIVDSIKEYRCKIDGLTNLDSAQVTSGGLSTSQFDNKTFESKLQKGLYAIGEVLDVDGECGGYNLSFALMSALACVDGIYANKG